MLYFFLVEYRDPSINYVIIVVKNRIREDAIITWNENGLKRSKVCARSLRCNVAFEMKVESEKALPIAFTAKSKQSGARLMINSNDTLKVQPLPYRKIVNAIIDFEGLFHFGLLLEPCKTTKHCLSNIETCMSSNMFSGWSHRKTLLRETFYVVLQLCCVENSACQAMFL